ncbi:putative ABC-type xenobiotic transporter [Dioscorea sansibarensis]
MQRVRVSSVKLRLINTDATLFFHTIASMEWVLIRVEALQNLIILASALSIVLIPQGTIARDSSVYLCLAACGFTSIQVFLTRWYSVLENSIISIERIKQYMHIQSEPPAIIDGHRPPHSWPQEGNIEFSELKVQVSAKFSACAQRYHMHIYGRTKNRSCWKDREWEDNNDKRFVSPCRACEWYNLRSMALILCLIGLKDLRMKLSIIPQEPTLFKGCVRTNLDPLGLYTDKEIWEVIELTDFFFSVKDKFMR